MSYLKIKDLQVSLSGNDILKGIDFHLEKGDFVGVIGPNGSGKSTLLKCIYRTLKPDKGAVYFEDKLLAKMPLKKTAQKIAVVGQHNEHKFDFTVFDMVMMGRSPYKGFLERDTDKDVKLTMNALKKVSMESLKDRNFSTLSGGEKQRVILARALAQDTECLILDEPTNHLDIRHQLEFMNVVKKLDLTVLFAVHDLNIALLYCNKICIVKDGQIIDYGNTKDLITSEMIKEIYGINAKVVDNGHGNISVVYQSVAY
ncbi:MAG: ABC transporter ATP-binding protein [Firmicutes bacterium]|jgi:iron complex transport system ATP-binding protein|nr:ABC transporter ATP-binding protein [Bacillota bacterium]